MIGAYGRIIAMMLVSVIVSTGCSETPSSKAHRWKMIQKGEPSLLKESVHQACLVNKGVYTVKRGDTLSLIAKRCQVPMQALIFQNHLVPPYTLYPQQTLRLSLKNLTPNFPKLPSGLERQWLLPVLETDNVRLTTKSEAPAKLFIFAKHPVSVQAVQAGEVIYAGAELLLFGKMIIIKHPERLMSVYTHLGAILVKKGQKVKAGQAIGVWLPYADPLQAFQHGIMGYLEARYYGHKIDLLPLFKRKPFISASLEEINQKKQ